MRRKNTRSATKPSPDKTPEPTRRSRRHSRRKRSTSKSSSDDSDDVSLKAVAQQLTVDTAVPEEVVENKEEEVPVWTVTQTASTPTGEIQKIKICLTRPSPSSPEKCDGKRLRNKSGSQTEEETTVVEEKAMRKMRRRSSPASAEDVEEQADEAEEKKGKGKSKSKHKSKSEKAAKIQEGSDETQSEISENVQVTPQSPQAANDSPVDNESVERERVGDDEMQNIFGLQNANVESSDTVALQEESSSFNDSVVESANACSDSEENHEQPADEICSEITGQENRSDEVENIESENLDNLPSTPHSGKEIAEKQECEAQETIEELKRTSEEMQQVHYLYYAVNELSNQENEITEVVSINKMQEMETEVPYLVEEIVEVQNELEKVIPESGEQGEAEDIYKLGDRDFQTKSTSSEEPEPMESQEITEEAQSTLQKKDLEEGRADDDSTSADVTVRYNTSIISTEEETNFNLTQSFSPAVRELSNLNNQLQECKNELKDLLSPKRSWGKPAIILDLLSNCNNHINTESIRELCPDLKLLDESELKMDVSEARGRRKSFDFKERKVSIEYSDELKRMDSHSLELDEVIEPEVDNSNIIAMNRKISIVEDTASKLKPPPSPANHPLSEVLFITNLVRPFTLKQLKELLERTGKIRENGFWADRIKSKCYVYYETVEEAQATRNALHGVNWPIGNGKKLIIDYSTPEDLETARNPAIITPPVPEPPIPEKENEVPPVKAVHKVEEPEKVVKQREKYRSEPHVREWDIGKEEVYRMQSRSRERDGYNRNDRRRYKRTPTPEDDYIARKQKKRDDDIPRKVMDDLFRKTKSTPSIYWLPLTPEEIATKQHQRLLRMAEHKRRMEEHSRNRGDYGGRGAPFRRRYD